jgi:hypothetical protein
MNLQQSIQYNLFFKVQFNNKSAMFCQPIQIKPNKKYVQVPVRQQGK